MDNGEVRGTIGVASARQFVPAEAALVQSMQTLVAGVQTSRTRSSIPRPHIATITRLNRAALTMSDDKPQFNQKEDVDQLGDVISPLVFQHN